MSNVSKLKKRALEYEQKKQFDKALETYIQVLGAMGEHVEEADVALYNRVGDLLLRQGNVGSAVDHYERAVDLYTDGGFHNNAIALCNKILRNAPGRSSIYYKLGRISAKKGFTNDAKQNFLEYADRMQRIGQFEEAFRALKEFADLCPDQDDIRLMLADQLVRGDRKAEAIEQLQFLFDKFESEGRAREAKATMERMKTIDPDHQPKPGVARPTPKVNDLIFLDVNYDDPGHPRRKFPGGDSQARNAALAETPAQSSIVPRGQPVQEDGELSAAGAAAAHADLDSTSVANDQVEEALPRIATEPSMPMLEADTPDTIDISPVEGLSSSSDFGESAGDVADADNRYGLVSHTDSGFITGFEETSLGGIELDADAIAPVAGIEHSTPVEPDAGATLDMGDEQDATSPPSPTVATPAGDGGDITSGDDFPLIDISLDLIDDSPATPGSELTFIFPDGDAATAWSPDQSDQRLEIMGDVRARFAADSEAEANADSGSTFDAGADTEADGVEEDPQWAGLSEDDLHLEPLLQLPEIEVESGVVDDRSSDLPLISQAEEEPDFADDDSPSTGPELQFLAVGYDDDDLAAQAPSEITGFEHLDIGSYQAAAAEEPAAPIRTVDALRASIELDPSDWELHRRLAEALLEEGDRHGGLAALEAAMLGFEATGDFRSATAVVDEMIRVEPRDVRFHQKRVEYAVRSGDRSLLADAYFSLAEGLFQMGELDKSRAVYARVLELSPDDERARAALVALDAIGATTTRESIGEPESVSQASENGSHPATNGSRPSENGSNPASNGVVEDAADPEVVAVPRPRPDVPDADAATVADFVNLSDWLREEEPTRNTRMVVDVKEPEIEEQVDFAEMLSMFKQGVAANVDESDHEAHYDLGVAYKEMGLLDEAVSEFQKALRGTERRGRTYEALGQCFVEKGQHQIAVTILSRALGDKSYTDDMLVGVLYLLGYASEALGRWADAQRFYERVFAVDIEFRDIGERLATAERGGR